MSWFYLVNWKYL